MLVKRLVFVWVILCANVPFGLTTQNHLGSEGGEDDANPLLDMASMFIQETLNSQNNNGGQGGGGGSAASLAGIASIVGSFMQANSGGQGKSTGGSGAMQILSGLGSLLANVNNNNNGKRSGGFDPSIIGNVIEMFTQNDDNEETHNHDNQHHQHKRETESGVDFGSLLQLASVFMNQNNEAPSHHLHEHQKRSVNTNSATKKSAEEEDNGFMSLLPLVIQAASSFAGPEGKRTQEKHKDHAWVLPPFLEHLHILWDHFSNSDLADALYEKSGVNKIMKGFKGRDGKLDYDKLFESLNNQSFRRRWIKSATLYLADWASYLANPEVYTKYLQTAQLMFNGFLKSQGYPKTTFFDPSRPSETISNLLDHISKHHLNVKIDSRQYVKPAVNYAKDLLKLGQARGVLQFNATDISEKLTDSLNLEVIEPVLKVHRAYRYVVKQPHCDRYVLCQLNDAEQYSADAARGLISGVSPKIVKVGSMGAAFFISTETGTPFWTLFNVITSASDCAVKYPVDCTGFHEGEAKVTTEYVHNEL